MGLVEAACNDWVAWGQQKVSPSPLKKSVKIIWWAMVKMNQVFGAREVSLLPKERAWSVLSTLKPWCCFLFVWSLGVSSDLLHLFWPVLEAEQLAGGDALVLACVVKNGQERLDSTQAVVNTISLLICPLHIFLNLLPYLAAYGMWGPLYLWVPYSLASHQDGRAGWMCIHRGQPSPH